METTTIRVPKPRTPRAGKLAATIAIALLIALGGFYSGVHYQKGRQKNTAATSNQSATGSGFGGGNFGGGFRRQGNANRLIGTVSAISSTSITVQSRTGTSKTLAITSSTTITNNGATASASDIQTGDTVFVTIDSSKTANAASIALNPSFGGGQGSSLNTTPSQDPTDPNSQTN